MPRNPIKPNPPLTGDPRYDQPCQVMEGTEVCGAMPSKQFLNWRGCINHTPAAMAGHEEPTAVLQRSRALTEKWTREAEEAAASKRDKIMAERATMPATTPTVAEMDKQPLQRSIDARRTAEERKKATKDAIAEARAVAQQSAGLFK